MIAAETRCWFSLYGGSAPNLGFYTSRALTERMGLCWHSITKFTLLAMHMFWRAL